ncbi:MAG: hypothetical protein EZS28_025373 [Streblomastix strix]|uniref:non-specific serine/threonine protein kinase n=1 Tax=Streblomastix strix TaxID=222440 RepID=A0A5J4V9H5_9EUKA|nr:MAG: hypothetical protein EZS28_025373 [Streblomastix strix]
MKSVEEPHNEKYVAGSKSSCAAQCHKDHKIKFLGMEIFECWCGVRNEQKCQIPCTDLSIASEKSDSEENSIASQNSIDPNVAEYDDFEIVQKLFGGVMGKTFLVMLKTTGKLYVMKRVDYLDEKDKMKADEEVHLVYTFVDRTDQYQITEFCSRGDLRKQINELQKLSEKERLIRVCELFTQIILALNFMHSMGVIHRDIKPENIFIMEDGTVRLDIILHLKYF